MKKILTISLLYLLLLTSIAQAQFRSSHISPINQKKYIDTLCVLFEKYYIDTAAAKNTIKQFYTSFDSEKYIPQIMNEIEFINTLSYDFRQFSQDKQIQLQYVTTDIGSSYFYLQKSGKANFLLRKKYQRILFGNNVKEWQKSEDFVTNKKLRKLIKKANTSWAAIGKNNADLIDQYGQPIKVKRKWRKNTTSVAMNWSSFYLLKQRKLKQELYDKINDQALYYNKKGSKNYLFGKHITLKQALQNYGFQEIKILEGNIAYLKISAFPNPNYIDKEILDYVSGFMANATSIIIDLQNVKEGDINFLPLLCSYFVGKHEIEIATQYCRYRNEYKVLKTIPKISKNLSNLTKQKLYILVNNQTSATAELLTQFLKKYRNATIIGQVTAGNAYLTRRHTIHTSKLYFDIPDTKIIVNQTDSWEKKGILPDTVGQQNENFELAYNLGLQNILDSTKNMITKEVINIILDYRKAKHNKIVFEDLDANFFVVDSMVTQQLKVNEILIKDSTKYIGNYEFQKSIYFANGNFFFKNYDFEPIKLLPISANLFILDNAPQFDLAPQHYFAPYSGSTNKICYLQFIFSKNNEPEIGFIFLDKTKYKVKKIKK
jgi:hypothetical protein